MTQVEVLEELTKFSIAERLAVAEAALRLIRQDLEQTLTPAERKQKLTAAAEALLSDYVTGDELTSFTALDSEDFYA